MKILFLTDEFPPHALGGSGAIAASLARFFVQTGHEVFVVTAVQNKTLAGETSAQGVKVYSLLAKSHPGLRSYASLYNGKILTRLKQILREVRPEIVHAHNLHQYLSYACLKAAKQSGAKVFLTAHDAMLFHYGKVTEFIDRNNPSPFKQNYRVSSFKLFRRYGLRYNPFRNLIIRHYLKYVDKIFSVSEALKEALNQNGIPDVEVIHNGIDIEQWEVDSQKIAEFKRKFNLLDKKVIMFGGRLSGLKGGEQAVRALTEIKKQVSEAVLLIAGRPNKYLESIRQLAKDLKVENSVVATGWLSGEELKAAYHASDLITVPSLYLDPFPTVILEAMACKKPVVATCFGGSPEIVVDSQTGYIVNPYNTEKLAAKIAALLKTPPRAQAFGEAGFRQVIQYFDIKQITEQYLRDYQNTA